MKTFLVSLFAVLFLQSSIGLAYDHKPITHHVEIDIQSMDQLTLAYRTDFAMDSLVKLAIWKLRSTGHVKEANRIEDQWDTTHRGTISRLVEKRLKGGAEEIGDYKPLSQWLSDLYKTLEAILGPVTMQLTHLDDIQTINYTTPVVFHMVKILGPVEIDLAEYTIHWNPFWGVVGYWSVWAGCTAATWGSGWFVICTPAGTASRYVIVHYIAPKLAPKGYELFWVRNLEIL